MVKKRYDSIDLAKWLAAFLVIYIHVSTQASPVLHNSPFWEKFVREGVCRLAVPFFLAVSAFFLFGKMKDHKRDFKRNMKLILGFCKRILLMYVVWSLIYIAYDLFYRYYNGNSFCAPSVYIWGFWFKGTSIHLWYLLASVYAVFIVYGLWCAGRPALIIACVLGCFVQCLETPYRWDFLYDILRIQLLTDYYFAVFRTFTMAVPLMCLGILCLQDHSQKTSKQWFVRMVIAAGLYVAVLISKDKMFVVFLLTGALFVYSLINWLCVVEFTLPGEMGKILRLSSTWIYCAHILVMKLYSWFWAYEGAKKYAIVCFFSVISGIPYVFINILLQKHKKAKIAHNRV